MVWRAQVEPGRIESAKAPRILARVSPAESVATAVSGAGFVREAVVEKIEIKQAVFREAELNAAPKTILASNTSTFGIDLLAQATSSSERVVGAHWFNPPQIVPCVEVVPGEATSQSTVERTVGLFRAVGEEPVVVKNVPAFTANRIQVAMVQEALRCLADGLASAEEIDRIVRTASGFRLAAYGPFEIIDQAGVDAYRNSLRYLREQPGLDRFAPPDELLDELADAGRHSVKTGHGIYPYEEPEQIESQRNRRLLRLLGDDVRVGGHLRVGAYTGRSRTPS